MRNRACASILIGAGLGLAGSGAARPPVPDAGANWARDGNIAIQEELDAARRRGMVDAYDLFIARHPRHPLADIARAERERLIQAKPR